MKKNILFRTWLILMLVFAATSSLFAQELKINGEVTNSDGLPLPASTIVIVGTTNGAVADVTGKFKLTVQIGKKLEVSSVGYQKKIIIVSVADKHLHVILRSTSNQLNETVVTALGISKEKRELGYAVATISGKDITKTQTPNFATALYGKLAGVRIASAPGGATSAAFIQVRGLESINSNTQPLIVLDGIPIRNDQDVTNNFGGNQIAGDGLLDINPEDIASISVLKGASAAALYGSEASNGVIVITTKKGGKEGFSVSFNASYSVSKLAYLPPEQNDYGPGYSTQLGDAGQGDSLWSHALYNGQEVRFPMATTLNFGPKFDGKPTLAWDGKLHPYVAQKNNTSAMYQNPQTSIVSIKLSNVTKKSNVRFDFTRQDNKMEAPHSKNQKNIADFNTFFNPGKYFQTSLMVDYINEKTVDRPYVNYNMLQSFNGMINRFDNASRYLNKYKTSLGYYYVTGANQSLTPDENLIYPGYSANLLNYFWHVNAYYTNEQSNRLIGTWKNTITPLKGLHLKTQIAVDYTGYDAYGDYPSTKPLVYGYSGAYEQWSTMDLWTYGQVMLNYEFEINHDLGLNISGGYNARQEQLRTASNETSGGLREVNFFNLAASVNEPIGSSVTSTFLTDGLFGILDFSYKNYLYVEATERRDRTSTMRPGNNTFFYPSANASFVFSDAFRLPDFISFGKIIASYGVVGNYPAMYEANKAYSLGRVSDGWPYGSVLYTTVNTNANDGISAEKKKEVEAGVNMDFFNSRLGVELNYYNGKLTNQIVPISLPASSGGGSKLANAGSLRNKGWEIVLDVTPIQTNNFSWKINFNIDRNINTVISLPQGLNTLIQSNNDGNAWLLVSRVGHPVGDIMVHPIEKLDGKPLIDQSSNLSESGLYIVNPDTMVVAGNTQPKAWGGWSNMFTYKGFSLNVTADFQMGGYVIPTGYYWMLGQGIMAPSLKWRDAAHGGLSYYVDASGNRIATGSATGPNGEYVYHDGLILNGVASDGKPNQKIASAEEYYDVTYNWGGPQYSPNTRYDLYVNKNTYMKIRSISLGYDLPRRIVSKIGATSLNISVFCRDPFYVYRTIKFMDPEILTGSPMWYSNVSSLGKSWSTRTFGVMVRANF